MMPHLDARALTEDPMGMDFLASVLDVSLEQPVHRFDTAEILQVADARAAVFQIVQRPEQKQVPEAA